MKSLESSTSLVLTRFTILSAGPTTTESKPAGLLSSDWKVDALHGWKYLQHHVSLLYKLSDIETMTYPFLSMNTIPVCCSMHGRMVTRSNTRTLAVSLSSKMLHVIARQATRNTLSCEQYSQRIYALSSCNWYKSWIVSQKTEKSLDANVMPSACEIQRSIDICPLINCFFIYSRYVTSRTARILPE